MNRLILGYVFGFVFLISVTFFANDVFADQVTVVPTLGSAQPGCENSGGCYTPDLATVNVGGKVIFTNTDSAAHTFTAGTPDVGPSGIFDSSLVMKGSSFEWNPTKVGEFPYFCMVHPWMTGIVVVQEAKSIANAPGKTITVSGTDIKILYKILGGTILSISTDVNSHSLIITASASQDGLLVISLPRNLIDAKLGPNSDDRFFILTDGFETNFEESKTSTDRILTIPFGAGTQEIEIIGTWIIGAASVQDSEPQPGPEPTCGAGTELVNGICVAIQHTGGSNPSDYSETDYSLYIIAGIGTIAVVGGGIVISKKKRSVQSSDITIPVSPISEKQSGKSCNVCGTLIPEGKNVCPSCGDTYSV